MFFKKVKTLYENLEKVIFKFPKTNEVFKLSHFLAGILVTGSTRSGKTSAVLKWILQAWFRAGYGGLFTSTRVGDAKQIKAWAESCGRGNDVVLFDKGSSYSMNLLEFEMNRTDKGGGDTNNLANLILMIQELNSGFESGPGERSEESFWKDTTRTLITMIVELLKLARVPITWKAIRKLAISGFSEEDHQRYIELWTVLETRDQESQEWKDGFAEYGAWRSQNLFISCFDSCNERDDLDEEELEIMEQLGEYWLMEFPKFNPKTKSIIVQMILSTVRPFVSKGILKSHFSNGVSSEIHPDRTIFDKKIVVIGFGVKEYGVAGLCATAIMKLLYQQAWERRNLELEGANANPVMLNLDEFQMYLNPTYDALFASTCGGSLVSQVYVTQNLDSLILASGSTSQESRAKSLCGNLNTKIFAANSNISTNKWASEMIGSHFVDTTSTTINIESSNRQTFNQQYHPKVPSDHFTTLKTGRKENGFQVETIVTQTGRKWTSNDEQNYMEVTFEQDH